MRSTSSGGRNVARDGAVDRDARAVHVRIDVPRRRHEESAGVHANLALQAAVDGDVLAARDFTGNDERRSNSGHGVQGEKVSWLGHNRASARAHTGYGVPSSCFLSAATALACSARCRVFYFPQNVLKICRMPLGKANDRFSFPR